MGDLGFARFPPGCKKRRVCSIVEQIVAPPAAEFGISWAKGAVRVLEPREVLFVDGHGGTADDVTSAKDVVRLC